VRALHAIARARVEEALETLAPPEREIVLRGMGLYARALQDSDPARKFTMRAIRREDNPALASLLQTVMPEFDIMGPGTSLMDPEISRMHESYRGKRAFYVVLRKGDRVVGGAGIGPLPGADRRICELRKAYLLPEARGLGFGRKLVEECLKAAKARGYAQCYLETVRKMRQARGLYEKMGFKPLPGPLGRTGHYRAEAWYLLDLRKA
jgi:putative acetyltransferase